MFSSQSNFNRTFENDHQGYYNYDDNEVFGADYLGSRSQQHYYSNYHFKSRLASQNPSLYTNGHYDFVKALNADKDIKTFMSFQTPQKLKLTCSYHNCPDSDIRFSSYIDLAEHMNKHSIESDFKPEIYCDGNHSYCNNCPFTVLGFSKESEKKEHKQQRLCLDCKILFSRVDNLKTHITAKNGKPSPCKRKLMKKNSSGSSRKFKAGPAKKSNSASPLRSGSPKRKKLLMEHGQGLHSLQPKSESLISSAYSKDSGSVDSLNAFDSIADSPTPVGLNFTYSNYQPSVFPLVDDGFDYPISTNPHFSHQDGITAIPANFSSSLQLNHLPNQGSLPSLDNLPYKFDSFASPQIYSQGHFISNHSDFSDITGSTTTPVFTPNDSFKIKEEPVESLYEYQTIEYKPEEVNWSKI
ncbi:hypothetical protein DASC09_014360 [Saccharomycopsis crataegensis]|uniref:C2H2-type domain-containing protein n=1 Tax=Saccharomycopsis crataegensis TaxID=43959 RepID=A0AAV5QHL6_9ASCO|nr:hypothetical protein DASC09_014360 [Saccharomycopsis crataegensis]